MKFQVGDLVSHYQYPEYQYLVHRLWEYEEEFDLKDTKTSQIYESICWHGYKVIQANRSGHPLTKVFK